MVSEKLIPVVHARRLELSRKVRAAAFVSGLDDGHGVVAGVAAFPLVTGADTVSCGAQELDPGSGRGPEGVVEEETG